ncbi:dihydrofolate reductase family protein [Sphingomonas sp. BT-65]|uniref:dihydrofolate reductase family protein n=1 Tax=Sphingomonas sp. BT-65 TaxID=2989821 RepID=UPI002235C63F|nr:dihydrofolate reductase family protein [Sphingomonas sp. BT-65]MCW4463285.1 dihydrofolate reductase family protein [Sphingomonas sp. BT-65]
MRKIIAAAFVSLDGVMQAPGAPEEDPTSGFEHGGWLVPHFDETTGAAVDEMFARPFDLLLGRKTYDIFAAHWPHFPTDPDAEGYDELNAAIALRFDAITKYVASRSQPALDWQNSELLGPDVPAALRELKRQDGPDLLTQGSSELLQTLLAEDLVDELRLMIFPIVLGKGKRMFGEGAQPAGFRLVKSAVSPSGVIIAAYERAGAVETGSFAMEEPTQAELERRAKLED